VCVCVCVCVWIREKDWVCVQGCVLFRWRCTHNHLVLVGEEKEKLLSYTADRKETLTLLLECLLRSQNPSEISILSYFTFSRLAFTDLCNIIKGKMNSSLIKCQIKGL
jgi:hypothetical protein